MRCVYNGASNLFVIFLEVFVKKLFLLVALLAPLSSYARDTRPTLLCSLAPSYDFGVDVDRSEFKLIPTVGGYLMLNTNTGEELFLEKIRNGFWRNATAHLMIDGNEIEFKTFTSSEFDNYLSCKKLK